MWIFDKKLQNPVCVLRVRKPFATLHLFSILQCTILNVVNVLCNKYVSLIILFMGNYNYIVFNYINGSSIIYFMEA